MTKKNIQEIKIHQKHFIDSFTFPICKSGAGIF